jgi:hypothetical protein
MTTPTNIKHGKIHNKIILIDENTENLRDQEQFLFHFIRL